MELPPNYKVSPDIKTITYVYGISAIDKQIYQFCIINMKRGKVMKRNNLIKKGVVVAVILLFIGLALAPSINATILKTTDNNHLSEITSMIICSDGIKSYKIKISDAEAEGVNKLLDNIGTKFVDVTSREECNIIFEEALIELDKYGLLGGNSVKDVIKIINTGDNPYSINGQSTHTNFLGSIGIRFYELEKEYDGDLGVFFDRMWQMFFHFYNIIRCRVYSSSWITFGYAVGKWDGAIYRWIPTVGNITIVSSEGEEEFNDEFYGQIDTLWVDGYVPPFTIRQYCVGVTGFKGINIGDYYFGSAKEVNIDINHPDI